MKNECPEYGSTLLYAANILRKFWAPKFIEAGGDENESAAGNILESAARLERYAAANTWIIRERGQVFLNTLSTPFTRNWRRTTRRSPAQNKKAGRG